MMKLIEYRKSLGLSQDEMGQRLGVTSVTYGQWETGKRTPSGTTLMKMTETFQVVVTIRGGVVFFTPESEFIPPDTEVGYMDVYPDAE